MNFCGLKQAKPFIITGTWPRKLPQDSIQRLRALNSWLTKNWARHQSQKQGKAQLGELVAGLANRPSPWDACHL